MSHGLSLLRALIDAGARAEFSAVLRQPGLFLETELPAFNFVARHYREHGQLPSPTAMAEGGFILPRVDNPVSYYLDRCTQRSMYNSVSTHQAELAEAMRTRNMTRVAEIVVAQARSVTAVQSQRDIETLTQLVSEVLVDYEHAHRHPGMQGVTLGWQRMDTLTGGVEPGDIVTFAARPGMGKSWLLSHIANRAWEAGTSVLLVSMEMTGKQLARRILGMRAGVNPDHIRRGQLSGWTHGLVYQQLEHIRSGVPFHILSGSFDKSVPIVDAAIQEFSPGLVCIDASYLLDPANKGKGQKMFEALTDVAKEIKSMAMARNKGIIQTVQFNREATKSKKRGTEHIGGSDAVGQITTIGVSIKEGPTPREQSSRRLDIFKNREGEDNAGFDINFLFNPPDFSYIPRDGETTSGEAVTSENLEAMGGF